MSMHRADVGQAWVFILATNEAAMKTVTEKVTLSLVFTKGQSKMP